MLFGKKEQKKDKESHVELSTLRIQRGITIATFSTFFLVLGSYFALIYFLDTEKLDLSLNALNIFLPIITSWIGAIIAFYFSKEFSDALIKKMENEKEKNKETEETTEKLENKYKEEKLTYNKAILGLMKVIEDLRKELKVIKTKKNKKPKRKK